MDHGDDRDGPSHKRPRTDPTSASTITILVDGELTSLIVGKGGSTIKQLESDFQVRIQCDKPSGGERGGDRPVIVSSAAIDNKVMAIRSITEMLLSAKPAPQATIKLVVPPEAAPVIIGKQGSSVKQMMSNSGAHIDVLRDGDRVNLPQGMAGCRLAVITGNINSACTALSIIAHRLAELESGNQSGSNMGRGAPSQMDSQFRMSGRPMDPPPYARMDQFPNAGPAFGMPVDMGMMRGSSDMGMMRGSGDMGMMRGGDMGMMRGSVDMGMMRGSGDMAMMRGSDDMGMNMMRGPGGGGGGGSFVPPQFGTHNRGNSSRQICTLNMFVPAGIVRLVIGKAGANIKDVIRQCDDMVSINVEKEHEAGTIQPPEMCAGTQMRAVMIKGASYAVLRAAYIIQEKVSTEYEDLQWTVVALHPPGSEHHSGRH